MFAFVAGLQILIQKLSETPKNMAKTLLQVAAHPPSLPATILYLCAMQTTETLSSQDTYADE